MYADLKLKLVTQRNTNSQTASQLAFCNIKRVYQSSYTHVKSNRWMRNRVNVKESQVNHDFEEEQSWNWEKRQIYYRLKYTSVNRRPFKKIRHRKISRQWIRSLFWMWSCYVYEDNGDNEKCERMMLWQRFGLAAGRYSSSNFCPVKG